MLPSAAQVAKAAEKLFVLEDVQNFGADYERTLFAWEKNFARSWNHFKSRYGERFYRMWRFYLLSCAGAFRARNLQVFQFLFSKGGTRYLPACTTWLYPERIPYAPRKLPVRASA
jgi:cyclopropane-fatty-acyl-phospholipid synthase